MVSSQSSQKVFLDSKERFDGLAVTAAAAAARDLLVESKNWMLQAEGSSNMAV